MASVAHVPKAEAGKTKVVVDANAIVKGIRLERLAEEAVTIPEVLREIKDKQARHTLATLPFELLVRDPDEESIKAVRRFARLTGDLGALSDPDIRCIALHLALEREAHGLAHVRTEPPPCSSRNTSTTSNRNNRGGITFRTNPSGPSWTP